MSSVSPDLTSAVAPSPLVQALPYVALGVAMLSFSFGTSLGKQLFPLVGAAGTVAYRAGFSALLLLLIFRPWRTGITRTDLFASMRYGAVLGLMNLSFYLSIRTIPLGLAMAIEFLGPLCVSLAYSRRPAQFAMVALAAGGLALLLPIRETQHALDPVGIGFALFAGVCWALYIVLGKRTAHLPGGQAVALGMATAALVVVPVGVIDAGATLFTPSFMLLGVLTALVTSAIPYSLEMVALKRISATQFGILLSVEPAVGALAGMILLREHLTVMQWVAIGLVVAASIGSVRMGRGVQKDSVRPE